MRLLIVDDAPEVVESVQLNFLLLWPDLEVSAAGDARAAMTVLREGDFDVILLDIGLPDRDGFEVLREIRQISSVPIVMLTARDGIDEKIRGLQLGADDYVTKPFNHRELIERVRAVLRREELARSTGPVVRLADLEIDVQRQEVRLAGRLLSLTPTEYNVLQYLAAHNGVPQSHEAILSNVWGREYRDEVEYLRVYIRRLREKLGDDPERPTYLATVRGYGYRFGAAREAAPLGADSAKPSLSPTDVGPLVPRGEEL